MIKLRLCMILSMLLLAAVFVGISPAGAGVLYQCPPDEIANGGNGNGIVDGPELIAYPGVACLHSAAGDGFVMMADRRDPIYMFSYHDITTDDAPGFDPYNADDLIVAGTLAAELPAPTIVRKEGDELYWTLTNVGMQIRPDLFDPHTIHYHGFPHASTIFDGVPDVSVSINQLASLTYYFKETRPGTYIYHCHVEATEHMQMGMYGSIWVQPAQNGTPFEYPSGSGKVYTTFAYNDGDGSTGYTADKEYPFQISALDSVFHDASLYVQPLPFALMDDDYGLINGRGYPDTTLDNAAFYASTGPIADNLGQESQNVDSIIEVTQGDVAYLHVSNLSVIRCYTLASLGIPMRVVGKDIGELKSASGEKLHYYTSSVEVCGGDTWDILLETADVDPGTYFLYTTNLNYLSNGPEDFGGIMTEVTVLP